MSLSGAILPLLMIGLGVAMIVRAIAGGGGALAVGVLVGLLFAAAGLLRLYVERRGRS